MWGDAGDKRCWQLVPLSALPGGRHQPQAEALVSFYSILHFQKHLEPCTGTAIQGLWWGQAVTAGQGWGRVPGVPVGP